MSIESPVVRRGRRGDLVPTCALLPQSMGYTYNWRGEYKQYLSARSQMAVILPMTIVLILFALYGITNAPGIPLSRVASIAPWALASWARWPSVV
jgi:multidrug efflux pump subunit AcrB